MINQKSKEILLKTVAIIMIAYLVVTLTLTVMGERDAWIFWTSAAFVFVYAKYIIPIVKKDFTKK
ncbi:MAG: hypothetical protein ACMXYG_05730 [Candidatus Woesearchaeota archaeon]